MYRLRPGHYNNYNKYYKYKYKPHSILTEKQSRATITCLSTEDSVLNTLRLEIWNEPVKQAANPLESGGCQNTNHTYPTTKIYKYDAYNMICYRQ